MSRPGTIAPILALLAAIGWVVACGDGTTEPPPPTPPPPDPPRATTLEVTPAEAELTALGATVQFSAEVRDQNGSVMTGAAVSWSSSNASVATVDASGLVAAAGNGTATITATSGSVSGSAAVTVAQAVGAVAVSPAAATLVARGDTVRLTAEATDANGHAVAGAEFEWSSSDVAVATVDASGLVTAAGNGTATIAATSGSVSGSAAVTVAQAVGGVAVSPAAATLVARGDTVRLTAEATDANGHPVVGAEFSWASGDTAVATVDSAGLVTASGNGTATITATSGSGSGEALVTVMQAAGSVVVSPAADTVALGDTLRFEAEAFDANGNVVAGAVFVWSSSDPSVAPVDAFGLVTGAAEGAATITATSGEAAGEALVTVMQAADSVVVSPASGTVAVGETLRLAARKIDPDGRVVPGATFAWWSSDPSVASVNAVGLVRGVAAGTARISAASGDAAAASEITVVDADDDRAVLVALYHATDGPNWRDRDGWLTDAPLDEWYGVETDGSGRVVRLELSGYWDREQGGFRTAGLSGELPAALGYLAELRHLDLRGNRLRGEIPPELGRLAALQHLDLSGNDLVGGIPPELGRLGKLQRLLLSNNPLGGEIPRHLAGLQLLERLWLYGNDLVGEIPPELGRLGRLRSVLLHTNGLTGTIPPELGRIAVLEDLDVFNNNLTGEVPSELANLARLRILDLEGNRLRGEIPHRFEDLSALTYLSLENNDGLCVPGTAAMVAWAEGRTVEGPWCNESDRDALESLYHAAGGSDWIRSDGWLGGQALGTWHGVSIDSGGRVTALDLEDNGLRGALTASLVGLPTMTRLRIGGNPGLAGRLPLSLTGLALAEFRYAGTGLCVPADSRFRAWLSDIPSHEGTDVECGAPTDRESLEALYWATDGPNWNVSDGWLTEAPLNQWAGVNTDGAGRVVWLGLYYNGLSGIIPPEIGNLEELEFLVLDNNDFRGPIPPEIGNLSKLTVFGAIRSGLSGPIPTELGRLTSLEGLHLMGNRLTGAIPPGIGNLARLKWLRLNENNLTGSIPSRIGGLKSLEQLDLDRNDLTGSIPPQVGDLANLERLRAQGNRLSGPIPAELGRLGRLESLVLSSNALSGPLPAEFGGLESLSELHLAHNAELAGALPATLTNLRRLAVLQAGGTGLCAPTDPAFTTWLGGIRRRRVPPCAPASLAYLTQAVQSREWPVPLVAGEQALLRVFATAAVRNDGPFPPVRASFHVDGALVHVADIPGKAGAIPVEIDEGDLSASANVRIPPDVVRPGLEMVIEVDPDRTLDPALGVARRIPETGRLAVDVRALRRFDITAIPFLWAQAPDSAAIGMVAGMAADPEGHELLHGTRELLPVRDLAVEGHEPVWTSSNNMFDVLNETILIRTMEGGESNYMGLLSGTRSGPAGVASADTATRSISTNPSSTTIAHEFGHNMGLRHAPCGGAFGPDEAYPQPDGTTGDWGYDFRGNGRLVPPRTGDLMSYCSPRWIGSYHFSNALRFRLFDEGAPAARGAAVAATPSLLLWGGADAAGKPFLNPAFVVDAPASLPDAAGEYRVAGRATDGQELFSLSFSPTETADGDGRSSFVFALPVRPAWGGRLASIVLTGPDGSATLDARTDRPMAILRDPASGQVRAILRDLPPAMASAEAAAAALPSEPGLEVLFSRGIPEAGAWRR